MANGFKLGMGLNNDYNIFPSIKLTMDTACLNERSLRLGNGAMSSLPPIALPDA